MLVKTVALKFALRKMADGNILNGFQSDRIWIGVHDPQDGLHYMVGSKSGSNLTLRKVPTVQEAEEDETINEVEISIEDCLARNISYTFIRQRDIATTENPWEIIWRELSGAHKREQLSENSKQRNYERSLRFTTNRIELLSKLVDLYLAEPQNSGHQYYSPRTYLKRLYGDRVQYHPEVSQQLKKLWLNLDSLVASGDLDQQNREFRINGKSLETIANYTLDQRRHKDSQKQSRRMVWLTFIIAGAAAADIAVRLYDYFHS